MVDQAGQQDARQKGLTCAGGAEDTRGSLDEALEIDADWMVLLTGAANDEVTFLFRFSEDLGDVALARQARIRVVRGQGLDRHRTRFFLLAAFERFLPGGVGRRIHFRPAFKHQGGQHDQVGEKRLAVQQTGQAGRQAVLALLVREARVGGAKLQISGDAVELPVAALNHDEAALLDLLGGHGQPDIQVFLESAADHVADGLVGWWMGHSPPPTAVWDAINSGNASAMAPSTALNVAWSSRSRVMISCTAERSHSPSA